MIDVIIITTNQRSVLLKQTVESLGECWTDGNPIKLTVVHDDYDLEDAGPAWSATEIFNDTPQGASASRNIGASSIPKYRRQKYVCFLDDDVYCVPGWGGKLIEGAERFPRSLITGHEHPYNGAEPTMIEGFQAAVPLVISTVNFFMPWEMWDDVGYFVEPGGPGGSEDYDWCMRATAKGYGFVVARPNVIIHCGLTSSTGKQIVGYNEMVAHNKVIVAAHGLEGKVIWH